MTNTGAGRVARIVGDIGKVQVHFAGDSTVYMAAPDVAGALRQAEMLGLTVHFTYDDDMNILGVVAHNQ